MLLEQRTKDIAGAIGQVRGFDRDEFLSDWELKWTAVPWSIGSGGWVSEGKEEGPVARCRNSLIGQ